MSLLTSAIYDRMANDSHLQSVLATFQERPAIFTQVPLPDSFEYGQSPYIITEGPVTDDTDGGGDTKLTTGRAISRDVRMYQTAYADSQDLEDLAEYVWGLFHENPLGVDGYETIFTRASGPTIAPTSQDDMRGRVISIVTELIEEV